MITLAGSPDTWAKQLQGKPEVSKYRARRTIIEGHRFDSHAEAMRYCQLKLMQEGGAITDLACQTPFTLQDGFIHQGKRIMAITYYSDFTYREGGHLVAEDVKGVRTQVYLIKRKMLLKRYPDLDFREVEC
jgi:hypothetical protein